MPKKLTQEVFIERAKEIHGDKYDYSRVIYINNDIKICVICKKHGEFWIRPQSLLNGHGCLLCGNENNTKSREDFVREAQEVHGNKYDYSKVNYIKGSNKVCIICKTCGKEFWQTPKNHLAGRGCRYCFFKEHTKGKEEFIKNAIFVHGDRYDYSKVEYVNALTKVCIICPEHGEFWMKPNNHISGMQGCPICSGNVKMNNESFIAKAREVHCNKYDYSLVKYVNNHTKVCIICPIHGEFWQKPGNHLNLRQGCPHCSASKGEIRIEEYLKDNNIEYIPQYKVKLQEVLMFGINNPRIDFYLSKHNTFIEFNGIQHYEFSPYFHKTEEDFNRQIERDNRLKEYCKRNKIKLIVIKYNQIEEIENILNKKLKKE